MRSAKRGKVAGCLAAGRGSAEELQSAAGAGGEVERMRAERLGGPRAVKSQRIETVGPGDRRAPENRQDFRARVSDTWTPRVMSLATCQGLRSPDFVVLSRSCNMCRAD